MLKPALHVGCSTGWIVCNLDQCSDTGAVTLQQSHFMMNPALSLQSVLISLGTKQQISISTPGRKESPPVWVYLHFCYELRALRAERTPRSPTPHAHSSHRALCWAWHDVLLEVGWGGVLIWWEHSGLNTLGQALHCESLTESSNCSMLLAWKKHLDKMEILPH